MYVCEWLKPDLELPGVTELSFLSLFDFTYHYDLESCKLLAHMNKQGYIMSKSLDYESESIHAISDNIKCLTIWVYENGEVVSKYDWNDSHWYYEVKTDSWEEDWKDMLFLPSPIKEFD